MTTPPNRPSPNQSTGWLAFISPRLIKNAFNEPLAPKMYLTPTAPTNGGNTSGASINTESIFFPGKIQRCDARARGKAIAKAPKVLNIPIIKEFQSPSL